jgi:hypothetical protein
MRAASHKPELCDRPGSLMNTRFPRDVMHVACQNFLRVCDQNIFAQRVIDARSRA